MYSINEQQNNATSMLKCNSALQFAREPSNVLFDQSQGACKSHWEAGYWVVACTKSLCDFVDEKSLQIKKESVV